MGQLAFCSLLNMKMLVALTLLALGAATPEAEADPYYGYSRSYGLARSYGGYGGYGLSHGGYGGYGRSHAGYGRSYGGYGGYGYGKREAEASPAAEAVADPYYGYGYGRSYGLARSYG